MKKISKKGLKNNEDGVKKIGFIQFSSKTVFQIIKKQG